MGIPRARPGGGTKPGPTTPQGNDLKPAMSARTKLIIGIVIILIISMVIFGIFRMIKGSPGDDHNREDRKQPDPIVMYDHFMNDNTETYVTILDALQQTQWSESYWADSNVENQVDFTTLDLGAITQAQFPPPTFDYSTLTPEQEIEIKLSLYRLGVEASVDIMQPIYGMILTATEDCSTAAVTYASAMPKQPFITKECVPLNVTLTTNQSGSTSNTYNDTEVNASVANAILGSDPVVTNDYTATKDTWDNSFHSASDRCEWQEVVAGWQPSQASVNAQASFLNSCILNKEMAFAALMHSIPTFTDQVTSDGEGVAILAMTADTPIYKASKTATDQLLNTYHNLITEPEIMTAVQIRSFISIMKQRGASHVVLGYNTDNSTISNKVLTPDLNRETRSAANFRGYGKVMSVVSSNAAEAAVKTDSELVNALLFLGMSSPGAMKRKVSHIYAKKVVLTDYICDKHSQVCYALDAINLGSTEANKGLGVIYDGTNGISFNIDNRNIDLMKLDSNMGFPESTYRPNNFPTVAVEPVGTWANYVVTGELKSFILIDADELAHFNPPVLEWFQ